MSASAEAGRGLAVGSHGHRPGRGQARLCGFFFFFCGKPPEGQGAVVWVGANHAYIVCAQLTSPDPGRLSQ